MSEFWVALQKVPDFGTDKKKVSHSVQILRGGKSNKYTRVVLGKHRWWNDTEQGWADLSRKFFTTVTAGYAREWSQNFQMPAARRTVGTSHL